MTLTLPNQPQLSRFALCGLIPTVALLFTFALLLALDAALPDIAEETAAMLSMIISALGLVVGGTLWAGSLARLTDVAHPRRFAVVGGVTHAIMTILAILVLGRLEETFVQEGNTTLPIHVLYTLLFVPATFICAFVVSGALGLASDNQPRALRMALWSGLAAALAFLALNVLQDLLGRRVGGPNAAATATMITVTLICMLGASVAMSAAIGKLLREHHSASSAPSA